jgi:hypothetical protein
LPSLISVRGVSLPAERPLAHPQLARGLQPPVTGWLSPQGLAMKLLPVFAVAALLGGMAHARPLEIRETARLDNPDPSYEVFGWQVALDGDYALGVGYKTLPDPEANDDTLRTVFLFRRINGVWTYIRPLLHDVAANERDGSASHGIDMRHGIAALSMEPLQVFERVGTDYVEVPVQNAGFDRGNDVYVDRWADRIILGDGCWGASMVARDPDGTWRGRDFLPGDNCGSDDGASGGPVATFGGWAVVANPYNVDQLPGPALTMFASGNGSEWNQVARIVVPEGHLANEVAIGRPVAGEPELMLVEDAPQFGTAIYRRRPDTRDWYRSEVEFLRSSNDWMGWRHCISCWPHGGSVEIGDGFLLRHAYDSDGDRQVVHVYTRHQESSWAHAATLVASDGGVLTGRIAISGRRVLLGGSTRAYYYELPADLTTPAVLQDTFAGSTATGWTAQPGSSFSVAQSGISRVYRQSSVAGEAGAVLDASNRTDQAIQADVKPTAVNGADRWAGLVTRRGDSANYYYVTLRSSGIIALKRMYQGRFVNLATTSLPFSLNRNYRLRLESVGTRHRVYVDGVEVLEASDDFLAQGRAGVLTYRMAADFDNVVVSPAAQTTIWVENGAGGGTPPNPEPWDYHGGQWVWQYEGSNVIFSQGSLKDWSRALAGPMTFEEDVVVEARGRLRAFGEGTDPWFGVAARASEEGTQYTYLALRRSNTVTLRKLSSAGVQELGAAAFNVTPGAWYHLRLEAVGNRLRGYVNGRLVIEAVDNQPQSGQAGLLAYRTQADFDDFRAVVP